MAAASPPLYDLRRQLSLDVSLHTDIHPVHVAFDFQHDQFEVTDGELTYFSAERTTALLIDAPRRRTSQLVQIQMRPKRGDIFAQAPYFRPSDGILGAFTVDVNDALGSTIRPNETGITTSRKVKYSHPIDGSAHFSQDGKVFTRVRRQSLRLDAQHGHLFEFHLYGLDAFDTIEPGQEKRARLYLPFTTTEPVEAVCVSASWVSKDWLRGIAQRRGEPIQPVSVLPRKRDGAPYVAYLIGHPYEELQSHSLLAVNLHPVRVPRGLNGSMFIMMGGWDPQHDLVKPGDRMGLLAMSYPCENIEELKGRLGSIDYDR